MFRNAGLCCGKAQSAVESAGTPAGPLGPSVDIRAVGEIPLKVIPCIQPVGSPSVGVAAWVEPPAEQKAGSHRTPRAFRLCRNAAVHSALEMQPRVTLSSENYRPILTANLHTTTHVSVTSQQNFKDLTLPKTLPSGHSQSKEEEPVACSASRGQALVPVRSLRGPLCMAPGRLRPF